MLLTPSNYQDVCRYYEDSFVTLKEVPNKVLHVSKVSRDSLHFVMNGGEEGVVYFSEEHPYHLDMVLPNKTIFQAGIYAFLMSRIPARQYSRGISPSNCAIHKLSNAGWTPVSVNFSILEGYFSKPNFPVVDQVLDLADGACSIALSPRFSFLRKNKTIYCDAIQIGTVNPKLKVIGVNTILVPEVQALLGTKSSYSVVGLT